ncbi:hypothetical protein [Flectobacillus major]|jgi:hypothetical protein|uniref:hypothetical protein n=1 Tax=Flectobacillus major TaxID=103 RepID=UPI00041414F8|nr:hypothetical protein [Flectobacillus major]
MYQIILLKPNNISTEDQPKIARCFEKFPSIIQWTVDWDDCDKIMRIVAKTDEHLTFRLIESLRTIRISSEVFID